MSERPKPANPPESGHADAEKRNATCQVCPEESAEVEILDAYSRAVITVAETVGPAVVGILALAGQPIASIDAIHHLLAEWPIGEPLAMTILRSGEPQGI